MRDIQGGRAAGGAKIGQLCPFINHHLRPICCITQAHNGQDVTVQTCSLGLLSARLWIAGAD